MRWSRIVGLTSLVILLVPSFGIALATDVIDVWTEESYGPGDIVKVEGSTNVTATVTVIITNGTGDEVLRLTDDPDGEGKFSVEFQLSEDASGGSYGVNATVGDIYKTTSFEVVAESDGDNETMTQEDLLSAIERAFRFIDKANATAMALQEDYDMALFVEKLNGLNASLTELSENIDPDDLEASVEGFRDIRREISQLGGLLSSVTKNVKEMKALQFTERMMRRIVDLKGRISGLGESAEVEEFRSSLDAQARKLERLWLTLNTTVPQDDLDGMLNELENVAEGVESGLDGLGGEGFTLKEMYKLQARIEVFNATVERMKEKGKAMDRLQEKLDNAEQLMEQMETQFNEKNWGKTKATISDADEVLGGVGKTIREMNRANKGNNGKGNGNK